MRLTYVLCWRGQHRFKTFFMKPPDLTRQFRVQWKNRRKRVVPKEDALLDSLRVRGISVVTNPWKEIDEIYNPVTEIVEEPIQYDPVHDREAAIWYDKSSLVGGLEQAQVITKSILCDYQLPDQINTAQVIPNQDTLVQKCLMNSHVFDATQKKLPKKINFHLIPEQKLHHNERREYGIPQQRRIFLLNWNLLRLCESLSPQFPALEERTILGEVRFSVLVDCLGQLYSLSTLESAGQFVVLSSKPLKQFANSDSVTESTHIDLPDIYPIAPAVNMFKKTSYYGEGVFPVTSDYAHPYLHTVILPFNFDHYQKKQENQMQARTLMYCFITAVSAARNLYGNVTGELIQPVTVQCIHTDGQQFGFSAFQLNTLCLDTNTGVKNMFWTEKFINLYSECCYKQGKPVLEDYNPLVMQKYLSLYLNGAT